MNEHSKKTYKNYRFNTRDEAYAEIFRGPPNTDRKYMHEMIEPNFEYLEQNGISEYQDFVKIFKDHGYLMKSAKCYIDEFKNYINSHKRDQEIKKIDWISDRQLKKTNSSEMNIILNRLSLEYPTQMSNFVGIFIQNHPNKTLSNDSFIKKIKYNIQSLVNSSNKMLIEIY